MQSPAPAPPSRDTGLPPGVEVGPLGARFVAYVIDAIVPAIAATAVSFLASGTTGGLRVTSSVVAGLIGLGWAITVLFLIATRAASPGMRLMKLQLVGFYDGRPVGFVRAFLRGLVFGALAITGIGLVIMLVLMVIHPRRQGWHDRLAEAVMIRARALAPPVSASSAPPVAAALPEQPAATGYASPDQLPPPRLVPPLHDPVDEAPPASNAPAQVPSPPPSPPQHRDPDQTAVHTPVTHWVAVLDDDRRVPIDGLVLLGRNPSPQPGEEDAQLIKLADDTRTVSKSHVAIGLDAAGVFVVDRGSTNGSTVTEPGGESTRCRVGEPVYVGADAIVSMGDHWLRIERVGG